MSVDHIVLQSAGSLSVVILGLLMVILQIIFFIKNAELKWFGWSAAISFAGVLYAAGAFIQYNTVPGPFNRFSTILEFTALICLIHSLYGFTFSYFSINGTRYHLYAGTFHALVIIAVWMTNLFVADGFITRHFMWLHAPYYEPAMGPLGHFFELYALLASITAIMFWILYKRGWDPGHRNAYVLGMALWVVFGFHDALVSMGVPSVQYVMEYGYFCFSAVVLWFLFSNYMDISMEDKYRVITELASDGILVIQGGKCVFKNSAASALIGKPIENLRLEEMFEAAEPEDRQTLMGLLGGAPKTTESFNPVSIRIQNPGEDPKILEIKGNVIKYKDRPAVLVVLRDITEKIREEEAMKERAEKKARLQKMESIGLLAGGVAHDLNNVLTGVISYPQLILLDLPETSSLREPLEIIKKTGLKAAAIVQDLLTLTRGAAIVKKTMDLNNLIRGYLSSPEHKKLMQLHPEISLRSELEPNLFNVNGSYFHLGKAIMNLVSNAFEAIEGPGTVSISTENRYLDRPLNGYDDVAIGEYIVLTVSDTGPGISEEDQKRVFEPFFTRKVLGRSGTGLGLSIVWNVTQDHDGYIDLSSSGNGTTFKLYFPVTREAAVLDTASIPIETLYGNGERILVVDDVESQRDITCHMLKRLNYRPKAVPGGKAAVEYIMEHSVDLVILDMIMDPGISGCETYKRITKIRPGQKTVIISGFSETDQVKEIQELGAGPYLRKPFLLEDLGRAVKETLNDRRDEVPAGENPATV